MLWCIPVSKSMAAIYAYLCSAARRQLADLLFQPLPLLQVANTPGGNLIGVEAPVVLSSDSIAQVVLLLSLGIDSPNQLECLYTVDKVADLYGLTSVRLRAAQMQHRKIRPLSGLTRR